MNSKKLSDYPDVLTFSQMIEILQVGKYAGKKLLEQKKIQHGRVGKKYVISKQSLVDFVAGIKQNT